ncbi:hypothetical protein ABPG72_020733 [Tetrahymena utriculariae]
MKTGIDIKDNPRAMLRLKRISERVKIEMSSKNESMVDIVYLANEEDFQYTLTRSKFEELCFSLFQLIIPLIEKVLGDVNLSKNQIHKVILAGGSCNMPKIQQLIQEYFNIEDLNIQIDPAQVFSQGAAIEAEKLLGFEFIYDEHCFPQVNNFSLGIQTSDQVMSVLIPRNSSLPCKQSQIFTTYADNQTSVLIKIFEGQRYLAKDNEFIGQTRLEGISPAPKGVPQIEVSFEVDEYYNLIVSAVDKATNKLNKISFPNFRNRLSENEINDELRCMFKFEDYDKQIKNNLETNVDFKNYTYSGFKSLND